MLDYLSSSVVQASAIVSDDIAEQQALVVRSAAMLGDNAELRQNVVIHCDVINQHLTINGNASFKGSVLNSTIMCFGHIRIVGSCDASTLYARGNISGFIFRSSDVFAEQNVVINREANESVIQAAASIFAAAARIHACRLSACDTILAHKVRSETTQNSELELGNIFLRRRKECILYRRMLKDALDLQTKREVLEALREGQLKGMTKGVSNAHLEKVQNDIKLLQQHAEQSAQRYHELCEQWDNPQHYRISVLAMLEAGTRLCIGGHSTILDRDLLRADYELENNCLVQQL